MKKKLVTLTSLIVALSLLVGFAFAAPNGNPFQEIWDAIFNIQAQIEPDYDSGWVIANLGMSDITLTHNLDSRDLRVYIYYKMYDPTIPSVDNAATHNIQANEPFWWASDFNEITIDFPGYPNYAWQEIRVLIWVIPD